MGIREKLQKFDTHSAVSKEFRVYSVQGAAISVLTVSAIIYLVFTEMGYNFKLIMTERVHVNSTSPTGLDVEFDISLPQIPCSLLNIDANDPSGQTQSLHLDRRHHIWKHRIKLDPSGDIQFIGDKHKLEQGSTLLHEEHVEEVFGAVSREKNDNEKDEEQIEDCGSCYGAGEEGLHT